MRKTTVYSLVTLLWFGLVVAAAALVFTGNAEPSLSVSQFPGEELGVIGAVFVGFVVGAVGYKVLERRAWTRAGRRAGLTPDGGWLPVGGRPDLTGTVRGRPVRVFTYEYTTGSRDHKETHRYTVVEANLTRPIEEGFMISVVEEPPDSIEVNFLPGGPDTLPDDAEFELVGAPSEAFREAILSGQTLEALRAQTYFSTIAVGDPSTAMAEGIPDEAMSTLENLAGGNVEETLRDDHAETAPTASQSMEGVLLDGNEMARTIEALVAVADAVDGIKIEQ